MYNFRTRILYVYSSVLAAHGGSGFIIDNRLCHTHVLGKRCAFVNNFPLRFDITESNFCERKNKITTPVTAFIIYQPYRAIHSYGADGCQIFDRILSERSLCSVITSYNSQ